MSADNATIIKEYANFNDYISDTEVLKAQEFIYEQDFAEKNNLVRGGGVYFLLYTC